MGRTNALTIKVHPSLILWLSIFFYLSPQLLLPFFLAAGFHELGHYIMLCHLKKSPTRLTLSFSGAAMDTPVLSYREEGLAAAAGPVFSFLLAMMLPIWQVAGLYSLILGTLNLFPVAGLDGARILSAVLYSRFPPWKARSLRKIISIITCLMLCLTTCFLAFQFRLGIWPLILAGIFLTKNLFPAQG